LLGAALLVAGRAFGQSAPSDDAASRASPPAPEFLELASDSSCPSPRAVSDILRQILGVQAGEHVAETARLERHPTELVVTLRSADARLLGERALPLEGDCDELARAAAVVLAAWISDAHPEFVPKAPLGANAAGAAAAGAPGAPAGAAASSAAAAAAAPPPTGSVRASGSVKPRGTFRLRVSLALGAAVLPTPPAFTASAAASFVPDGGGIGPMLRLGAVTAREVDVQGGRVRYSRWPFAAGAVFRFAGREVAAELDAGAALGWLHVAGRSFSPDRSANDATVGPLLAARASAARGSIRPFVELGSVVWARSARVYASSGAPSVKLPGYDVTLSLGASLVP
jgi:hypothetical protein